MIPDLKNALEPCECHMIWSMISFQKKHKMNIPYTIMLHTGLILICNPRSRICGISLSVYSGAVAVHIDR